MGNSHTHFESGSFRAISFPPLLPLLGRGCLTHGNKINFQSPFSFPEAIFAPLYKGRRALFSFAKNVLYSYSSFPSPATRQKLRKGEGGGFLIILFLLLLLWGGTLPEQFRSHGPVSFFFPAAAGAFPEKERREEMLQFPYFFIRPAAAVARLYYCSVQSMKQSASDSSFCFHFHPASITATLHMQM